MLFPYQVEYEARRNAWATYCIIGINLLIFLAGLTVPAETRMLGFHQFGYAPAVSGPVQVFTAMFMHGGWLHLIGNMYMLWLFGQPVENELGPARFVVLYLVAGIVAMAAHTALTPAAYADVPCVGASGAIAGILGAGMALAPGVRVSCVVMLFEFRPVGMVKLPAALVLGLWFFIQLVLQDALGGNPQASGVAYGAHLGGFVFGWVLLGGISVVRSAWRERAALQWTASVRRASAQLAQDQPVDPALASDPVVGRMRILKQGFPRNHPFDSPDEHAEDAVTLAMVLRWFSEKRQPDPPPIAVTRAARALRLLDDDQTALRLLLNGLDKAEGEDAQLYIYECATLLADHPEQREAADHCWRTVVQLAPDTPMGQSARYALQGEV